MTQATKFLMMIVTAVWASSRFSPEEKSAAFQVGYSRFMAQLDSRLLNPFSPLYQQEKDKAPWRIDMPPVRWTPVICPLLGLDLETVERIHDGSRNSVFKMVDRSTGKNYAYKVFDLPDEYTAELTVSMLTADIPHLVKPICIKAEGGRAGIVFEFIQGWRSTEFLSKLAQRSPLEQTYSVVQRMSAQLLEAISFLHYLGFIHADLKPENVMVDLEGNIWVIDFGFSLKLPFTKGERGTSSTMAPELIKALPGQIHEGIDWWAYGSTVGIWLGIIFQPTVPLEDRFIPLVIKRRKKVLEQMFRWGRWPAGMPAEATSFLKLFFVPDPDRRRFNTEAQLDFLKSTPFLRSKFL